MEKEKEEIVLTEDDIADLRLIQHSMELEGHSVSMESLIEMEKGRKASGDHEKIKNLVRNAKEKNIPLIDAVKAFLESEEN